MALQKTITLPNGPIGNYIVIGEYQIDPMQRRLSAHFHLYTSAAFRESHPAVPLRPTMAKLRLSGDAFDTWLSTAVLAEVESSDPVRAQIYAAAKAGPVISDWGSDVFADAIDVL